MLYIIIRFVGNISPTKTGWFKIVFYRKKKKKAAENYDGSDSAH